MKQIQAHKFSEKFLELLSNNNKILDFDEYEYCSTEFGKVHESKMIRYYIYTIILFIGGMWAVAEQVWFLAVLLLALAANYNRQSSHHILVCEIINQQRMLAMLINKKSINTTHNESSVSDA